MDQVDTNLDKDFHVEPHNPISKVLSSLSQKFFKKVQEKNPLVSVALLDKTAIEPCFQALRSSSWTSSLSLLRRQLFLSSLESVLPALHHE